MITTKKLLIALLALVAIGGGIFAYTTMTDDNPTNSSEPTDEELDQLNAADETPATEKEQSGGQIPTSETPQNPASSKQPATVFIPQADAAGNLVQVRAYATVFENGTCTATFTKGGVVKTYTENTELQSSYTQCNPFEIPKSDFSSGTWQLKLVFESTNYKGEATGEVSI